MNDELSGVRRIGRARASCLRNTRVWQTARMGWVAPASLNLHADGYYRAVKEFQSNLPM